LTTEILVDQDVARDIRQRWPECSEAQRPAKVTGPQPRLEPRPPMVQLLPVQTAHLVSSCVRRDDDGTVVRVLRPFVLDKQNPVTAPICRISANHLLIVSSEMRDFLMEVEPSARFEAVPFEGEAPPVQEEPTFRRPPSKEEILRATKRK